MQVRMYIYKNAIMECNIVKITPSYIFGNIFSSERGIGIPFP